MAEGVFIAVVGPSGVGKDSILEGARAELADNESFHFVTRTISRPADAGGEAHIAVSAEEFILLKDAGQFCLSWEAHGLYYGISQDVCDLLASGTNVIGNISRKQVGVLSQVFDRSVVIEITASEETIYGRLKARGRESAAEIAKRATRDVGGGWRDNAEVYQVSNDDTLPAAVEAFVNIAISLSSETDLLA